jgi:adenylate cyclase
MSKVNRKLTTILATDCVGFSRLMEENEELTLHNLKACRSIIDPIIKDYGGRIFHTAGDSVIAEFNSPVECVNAAIEFQKSISERNNALDKTSSLVFRVGIHLDDVIIEGDNIYGSGVNIASRLETECSPGQILLSRTVKEQVSKKIEFVVNSLGFRALKNISDSFEVFQVVHEAPESIARQNINTQSSLIKKLKPKLLVIPFTNTSKDEDSEYLVDGIVEDLITEFSMIKELDICSRQSAFEFKGKGSQFSDFAKNLNANFVVAGSIRSSGKRVRISVELNVVTEDKVVWSQKYDRVIEDIFDVQDEIVRKITIALVGEIEISSLNRSKRKPAENMTSYEYLIRAKQLHHKFTKEANREALDFVSKAIEADQTNAQALAWKACIMGQARARQYVEIKDQEAYYEEMSGYVQRAVDLDENDFECNRMLCFAYLTQHKYDKAEEYGKRAFDLNPNDPRVSSGYGEVLVRVGRSEEGIELLKKALDLDPVPMGQINSDKRLADLLLGFFMDKNYIECLEIGQKIQNIDFRSWLLLLEAHKNVKTPQSGSENLLAMVAKFRGIDFVMEIDRFHIQDEKINQSLTNIANELLI